MSFIPTLGTMIFGLIAGGWLITDRPMTQILKRLLLAGVIGLTAGWLLDATAICPNVKRIWTPSWTLFSGGWCFLLMAGFYWIMDVCEYRRGAFWLTVIGMNSIAAYLIAHLFDGFLSRNLTTHLGTGFFALLGESYEPLLHGAAVLLLYWLILYWMYRKRLFLKI